MKCIAHLCLLLVGLGVMFMRWIDLVNYIDPETGFVLVGSVWLRYGAIALLCLLAVVAGFMASRRPGSLERGCAANGAVLVLLGTLCAGYHAVALYVELGLSGVFSRQLALAVWVTTIDAAAILLALLGLICAAWLFTVAFAQFDKKYRLPAGGVCFGILGNLYFYGVLISRFAANQSSYHRLDPTISVFAGAALILFSTVLLRALYFPESAIGRKLYTCGIICFYLCVGFTLPQAMYDLMMGNAMYSAVCENILFAGFGVLGAVYATRVLSNDLA